MAALKPCAPNRRICLLALAAPVAWAQQPAAELKAQVLVKVLRFVEWPDGLLTEGQALQVCLHEDGALAQRLRALDGQLVNSHLLRVRSRASREPGACHVTLASLSPPSISVGTLLVGEEPVQADKGLMLSLLVEDGRVVFDIDLDAARRAGIGFSARLLRLARYVRRS